ncbi:hypothetical protein ACWEIJ_25605 [Lentzea sp. NPDC004789]
MNSRLRSVAIKWPQLVVDSLDERLDVTGFRLDGEQAADRELPGPRRLADDEPELPRPRGPVNDLGASVLPPTGVQFLAPEA